MSKKIEERKKKLVIMKAMSIGKDEVAKLLSTIDKINWEEEIKKLLPKEFANAEIKLASPIMNKGTLTNFEDITRILQIIPDEEYPEKMRVDIKVYTIIPVIAFYSGTANTLCFNFYPSLHFLGNIIDILNCSSTEGRIVETE